MSVFDPTFHLVRAKERKQSIEYRDYQNDWITNPQHKIVNDGPIQLDIELNTTCNYQCKMCFHSFDPPKPEIMPLRDVKMLIDQAIEIGVKSLKLNYRGEPLLYPYLVEVVQYAKTQGILETLINTNGSLLTPDYAKKLIKAGLGKIIFSVDGFLPETYAKIRCGGTLENVIQNIGTLLGLRQIHGYENPIVRVQIVRQEDNEDEIEKFIEFWSDNRADEVAIEDCKDYAGKVRDDTPLPHWYCSQLWQRMFILADGTILPCCRAMEGGNQSLYILGNYKDIQLKDAWKGNKLTLLRKAHREGMSHSIEMCQRCGLRKEVIKQNVW